MKHKVSELSGGLLDAAVALAQQCRSAVCRRWLLFATRPIVATPAAGAGV